MTDKIDRIAIIGGGLAAAKAAETLRDHGYEGTLRLVTDEPTRPYERPPLSKAVLVGDKPPESAYVHSEDFYRDRDIDVIVGDPVVDLDRAASTLTTSSGRSLTFDRALIATGARPRALPLTDTYLDGIVTLRTMADSVALKQRLDKADHVTIIGAGWIGCEVAAAARTLGTEVTMVDPLAVPLQRVLGDEVGAIFAGLHREHGVDLRLGEGVASVSGSDKAERVTLTNGDVLETDLVVVGAGVVPNAELAQRSGLEVDNGIVVDATLATSDPRIFAAGDVASAWHPRYQRHLRVEHWSNALNQGLAAGANILGAAQPYDRLPYFFTDQYDLGMEYVGHADNWDQVVIRGDRASRTFIAFWLRDRQVQAAMNVNIWDVADDLKSIILSDQRLDPARLADSDIPLDQLLDPQG